MAAIASSLDTPTRVLDSNFVPSTTVDTFCIYSINIALPQSVSDQDGKVELKCDMDTGSTVRATIRHHVSAQALVTNSASEDTFVISFLVPKGFGVLLDTTATAGSPTFTLVSQAEIPLRNGESLFTAGSGVAFTTDTLNVLVDGATLEIDTDTLRIKDSGVTAAKIAAAVAGNGLAGGAGTALSVNVDASTIEINADTLRVKAAGITESHLATSVAGSGLAGGGGTALSVNVDASTIEVNVDTLRVKAAGITESHLATSVAGSGLAGGGGTALSVNVDGATLEIVTDTLRVKDAGITAAKIAAAVAGAGLSGGAGSALSVNVDGTSLEIPVDTLQVKDAGITAAKLAAAVAGDGLTGGAGTALSVVVDGSTLEIAADTVRVKDGGITAAKVAADVATQAELDSEITNRIADVNAEEAARIAADALLVPKTTLITAGAGLTGGGDLSANRTLDFNPGTGLEIDTDAVRVKASDIAGAGLVANGASVLDVNPGTGIEIVADQVTAKLSDLATGLAGAGLVPNANVLDVNPGSGISIVGDAVTAAASVLTNNVVQVTLDKQVATIGDVIIVSALLGLYDAALALAAQVIPTAGVAPRVTIEKNNGVGVAPTVIGTFAMTPTNESGGNASAWEYSYTSATEGELSFHVTALIAGVPFLSAGKASLLVFADNRDFLNEATTRAEVV